MEKTVRQQLLERASESYRKFSAALIPNVEMDTILGVRLPELRGLAKQLAKGDWRSYLKQADSDYFEEVMLQGMVIGYAEADPEQKLVYVAQFVPKIDNWSVCDSFCSGLKFARANKPRVWQFVQPYLSSPREYDVRFGVVMLLNQYMEEEYISAVLKHLDEIRHDGYYAKMAVAWALSICYIKLHEPTLNYLQCSSLDDFTYNKALQKITESLRVDPQTRNLIRGMKRK